MRLTILHTNDIHGRVERIAQIATLVRAEKERSDHRVLYLDAGDVEETTSRLSNFTKGVAMHRLMNATLCDAATVGNACWLRYGPGVLAEQAAVSNHPQLVANFVPVDGPVPSVLLDGVGIFGLSDPFRQLFEDTDWGFDALDELEVARSVAAELRAQGAELVILLSHLGWETPASRWDDPRIAAELQADVDLIIGAHSHHLFPHGERVGRILVAQAGEFGEHLGRIEIDGNTITASVEPIGDDVEASPLVTAEIERIEAEVAELLAEPIGSIDADLDAEWIAEMLRRRMNADVGVFSEGLTLATIPTGLVTRGALYEASETGANPGITTMTGAQLATLVERGNDPAFTASTAKALRGRARGALRVAGVDPGDIDPTRTYSVAGSDWELDAYGGYTDPEWGLKARYDFPVIIREAIEDHLRGS
ncbi:MAG TPA: bifunctional UDP-sugar hydrolase/5'-nucleotidase [Gaiellaceae bacterium]|nr:bifunctional UDP-sugar hydrolase/5'-nucleotidase [Gaiellaceae bacterium]